MQNDIVPNENASLSMYICIYIVYTQCLTIDNTRLCAVTMCISDISL